MRIMPSCRDVIKSSPSPLMLMCMSARDAVAPFAVSTSAPPPKTGPLLG